ncbi:MAG: argininosuccinate lyase [Candidatus Lokiarchaeota archaeon]|nr:argininosuccinate lyase [Candidatus Lokiarchaeota archaeon]
MTEKPWNGRFEKEMKDEVLDYTAGADIKLDNRLVLYDIIGTEVHDIMLNETGILSDFAIKNILTGLEKIKALYLEGKFVLEQKYEDVHMNIEKAVINYIGEEDGGNIHIARSRNDQVQLDLRLLMRDEIVEINEYLINFIQTLLKMAEKNLETIMPGYTHSQHAQPITFAHWCLAYVDSFIRDIKRLEQFYKRINKSPLGSAAIAGVSWNIKRERVAELLGFDEVQENTLDCISNRGEFIAELLSIFSLTMIHLSKIAEDLILWSTYEFGMVEIDDSYASGSSIMPQKKNPDVCELVRARSSTIISFLSQILNSIKGLPSGYNRDHQETKYPLFKSIDITKQSIVVMMGLINTLKVNNKRMKELAEANFITATEIMDLLVQNGIPLRKAHKLVGKYIKNLKKNSINQIMDLDVEKLKSIVNEEIQIGLKISQEQFDDLLNLEIVLRKRNLTGGPAPKEVSRMIKKRKENIKILKQTNDEIKKNIENIKDKLNELIKSIINGGK